MRCERLIDRPDKKNKRNNLGCGGYWGAGYNGNYAYQVYLKNQQPCQEWKKNIKIYRA